MTTDVRELLPLYALGILESDEATVVERALAADPALARELASYRDATSDLVAPIAPSPEVKLRLLASIGGSRYDQYSAKMAKLFDVTVDRAREFLGLIERKASWELPMPGIGLVHFDGGPAFATADCGFIRLQPGTTFPPHTHVGEEVSVVLTGQIRTDDGRVLGPGDELVQSDRSTHHITCIGDEECIFATRATEGIEIAGAPVRFNRS
ncbi:MAG: cupin domain-containing protein [Kofleriaceae bacterium]